HVRLALDPREGHGPLVAPALLVVEDRHDGLGELHAVDGKTLLDLDAHPDELPGTRGLGLAGDAQQLPARAARGTGLEDPRVAVREAQPGLVALFGVDGLLVLLVFRLLLWVLGVGVARWRVRGVGAARSVRRRVVRERGRRDRHEAKAF